MTADDLSAPLGQGTGTKQRRVHRTSLYWAAIAVLGSLALVFAAWVMIADDPFGGEPVAIAPAAPVLASSGNKPELTGANVVEPAASDSRNLPLGPPTYPTAGPPPLSRTVTIIDGTSGKRQEIVIPGTSNLTGLDEPSSERTHRGASTHAFGNSTPAR